MMRRPNPSCKVVIEEQYIESTRRFREWTVLEAIHKGGRFPGVVRLQSHGGVKNKNGEDICVKSQSSTKIRLKPRVVLKDGGIRLMDIGTPKELLMGVYDLLESECPIPLLWPPNWFLNRVSRTLHRDFKILHRNISPAKVLFDTDSTESGDTPVEPLRSDLDDMCFSEYLVSDTVGQDDSDIEYAAQVRRCSSSTSPKIATECRILLTSRLAINSKLLNKLGNEQPPPALPSNFVLGLEIPRSF